MPPDMESFLCKLGWIYDALLCKPFPKELNFGNVFETSMMQSLNSKEYRQFRELWYKNEPPEFCKNCHLIDLKPININIDPELN